MGKSACYLDSNICIAYLQSPHLFHAKAGEILINIRRNSITPIISPLVLDETTHILLRDAKLIKQSGYFRLIKNGIRELLSLPLLRIVNPPPDSKKQLKIFEYMEKFNLKPRDAYHLLIMTHNKINLLATFDSDFDSVFSVGQVKRFS
jgi:predicted nucleic acid-binding protein